MSKYSSKILPVFLSMLFLLIGVVVGGYLFNSSQPRSILNIDHCESNCLKLNDITGLVVSVLIQKTPDIIPNIVIETDKTIVIRHPFPEAKYHYVIIPKKDIKDIAHLQKEDIPYIEDSMAVIANLVEQNNLREYKVITNGPGIQQVTYLHFHLIAQN